MNERTTLDAGAYKTEGSAHGPLRFDNDIRQAWEGGLEKKKKKHARFQR